MPCFNKTSLLLLSPHDVFLIIQNFKNYSTLIRCKLKFVAMDTILQVLWCFHGILDCFVFSTYFVFTDPELIAHVEIMRIMFSIATKTFHFLDYKNTP